MTSFATIAVDPDDAALWTRLWVTWNQCAIEWGPMAARRDPEERRRAWQQSGATNCGWWLCVCDGVDVGVGISQVVLDGPQRVGSVNVGVLTRARGRGMGRALAQTAMEHARSAGAERIDAWILATRGYETGDVGRVLATSLGFHRNTGSVVPEAKLPLSDGAMVSTPPAGYRLEYLTSAPGPELYDDLRALLRAMDRDVPQGEFGAVGHRYSGAALRTKFDAGDERQWIVIARSQDGSVAGYTELRHPVGPMMRDRLMQCDTVVLPKHRGHGLGIAMKSAALARACADVPGLAVVQTSVDQSNRPMLAINSRLGFQETARLGDWVRTRGKREPSN